MRSSRPVSFRLGRFARKVFKIAQVASTAQACKKWVSRAGPCQQRALAVTARLLQNGGQVHSLQTLAAFDRSCCNSVRMLNIEATPLRTLGMSGRCRCGAMHLTSKVNPLRARRDASFWRGKRTLRGFWVSRNCLASPRYRFITCKVNPLSLRRCTFPTARPKSKI